METDILATDQASAPGGMRRTLGTVARILGAVALFALVIDGALSAAWGSGWLEWQRTHTPRWYARIPAALLKLPDPALRAMGAAQTAASAAGLRRLR